MRRLIPLPAVVLLGACLASGGPRRAEAPTAPPKNPATDPTAPPTAPPTAAEATMDDAWTTLCAQRARGTRRHRGRLHEFLTLMSHSLEHLDVPRSAGHMKCCAGEGPWA